MAEGPTIKEGWLEKEAEWRMVWNPRLVCVRGRTISYRENERMPDKCCARIESLQPWDDEPLTFRVWTDHGMVWRLRAKTKTELMEWIKCIKAALTVEAVQEPLLQGTIEKQGYWMKTWNERYVVLKGVEMRYSEKEGMPIRKRHLISAADLCENKREIRIVTSDGESFHIRLRDESTALVWLDAILKALRGSMSHRWQAVPVLGQDAKFLAASHHCAAVVGDSNILLFGGKSFTMPKATPNAAWNCQPVLLRLSGEPAAKGTDVLPFTEAPGARVRPGSREMAGCAMHGTQFFVHAGRDQYNLLDDLWCIEMVDPKAPRWMRLSNPDAPPLLPAVYGHTLTSVGDGLLLVGGAESDGLATNMTLLFCPRTLKTLELPPLRSPRMLHGAAASQTEGCVLVVGGTSSADATIIMTSACLFDAAAQKWRHMHVAEPFPPMLSPAVCAHGPEWLVFGGDGVGLPSLLSVTKVGHTLVVRRIHCVGDTPRMHCGLSAHILGDYLYIIGDNSKPPAGNNVHRLLIAFDEPRSACQDAKGKEEPPAASAAPVAAEAPVPLPTQPPPATGTSQAPQAPLPATQQDAKPADAKPRR